MEVIVQYYLHYEFFWEPDEQLIFTIHIKK